jgi:hypothetical protein
VLKILLIMVVLGFGAAVIAWWLLRPHDRAGSDEG